MPFEEAADGKAVAEMMVAVGREAPQAQPPPGSWVNVERRPALPPATEPKLEVPAPVAVAPLEPGGRQAVPTRRAVRHDECQLGEAGAETAALESQPAERIRKLSKVRTGDLKKGSHAAREVEEDEKAASMALAWIRSDHPEWLASTAGASGIRDDAIRDEILFAKLAAYGKSYLNAARCAWVRYDAFAAANAADLTEEARRNPTELSVLWFVLSEQADSQARALAAGRTFKGTVALQLVKALKKAATAFGAGMEDSLLRDSPAVLFARRPAIDPQDLVEDAAHWPAFLQCSFEALAASEVSTSLDEVERDWARGFALMGVAGFRGVEGLRSRITGVTREDADLGTFVELLCDGGKSSRIATRKPFFGWIPDEGLTGKWQWIPAWADEHAGEPFIFRGVKSVGATKGFAWKLSDEGARVAATAAHMQRMFGHLARREPMCMAAEKMVRGGATPYGSRHLLPDLTRAAGWGLSDRGELGRWAPATALEGREKSAAGKAKKSPARSQQDNYSRDAAARQRQIRLRRAACRLVSSLMVDAKGGWQDFLPRQAEGPTTFEFVGGDPEDAVALDLALAEVEVDEEEVEGL